MSVISGFPRLVSRILVIALGCVMTLAQLPPLSLAQDAPVEPAAETAFVDIESAVSQADAHIKEKEYGKAIEVLEQIIDQTRANLTRLRDAYILLLQAHIGRANFSRSEGDLSGENVWLKTARAKVVECLSLQELRDTYPRSDEGLYDQMKPLFDGVRNELFGGLRIAELDPPDAIVILEGDTLFASPAGEIEAVNIPHGLRLLVIQASGYQTRTEDLDINAGTITEGRYQLKKNKGFWFFAKIVAGIGVAGFLGNLILPGDDE